MNKIKTIKIGDIEVPVEYLKQTTVNVNGDDYIRLQQENKQLKDKFNQILEEINWVKDLIDTCEYVDTNAITIYKIIKGDNNEYGTLDEHYSQTLLPCVSHSLTHSVCKECVETH